MDISVILVSSDSSMESVGTSAGRVILFGTITTTIPDTTPTMTPPTTHVDTTLTSTEIPIVSPIVSPSPDYTPTSPDYLSASDTEPPDTAYPLIEYGVSNLLPRQRIDCCSLNNVSCSSKQYDVFCKLNTTLRVFPISLARAASEWFKKDCIGSVTTWENLVEKSIQKFYQPSDDKEEMEADEDDDPDDIVEIFKIEGNLSDFDTPLCKAFNEFNYLLKIDTDLFTFDMQGIKTYEEYGLNNNMMGDLEEPWNYVANNTGNTQGNKKEHHDPSIYHVRRFEMIKHSFDADEEYVAIKEHEHLDHSITNIDSCQTYRELFRIMDEG
nr:hypothetical protein [Tanacetum cinerariifolium]